MMLCVSSHITITGEMYLWPHLWLYVGVPLVLIIATAKLWLSWLSNTTNTVISNKLPAQKNGLSAGQMKKYLVPASIVSSPLHKVTTHILQTGSTLQ